MGHSMSSIHDSFEFIKKIAELRTIEEACAEAGDDDALLEINQEYKHSLEDEVSSLILEARALITNHPHSKETS